MLPNDAIMVDNGFLIEKECALYNVKLIRPPFLKKTNNFPMQKQKKLLRSLLHVFTSKEPYTLREIGFGSCAHST